MWNFLVLSRCILDLSTPNFNVINQNKLLYTLIFLSSFILLETSWNDFSPTNETRQLPSPAQKTVTGDVEVRRRGGVEVWRCGGAEELRCGGAEVWKCNFLHRPELAPDSIITKLLFQMTIYHFGQERNARRHHSSWITTDAMQKTIEKAMRNRIMSLKYKLDHKFAGLLYRDGFITLCSTGFLFVRIPSFSTHSVA